MICYAINRFRLIRTSSLDQFDAVILKQKLYPWIGGAVSPISSNHSKKYQENLKRRVSQFQIQNEPLLQYSGFPSIFQPNILLTFARLYNSFKIDYEKNVYCAQNNEGGAMRRATFLLVLVVVLCPPSLVIVAYLRLNKTPVRVCFSSPGDKIEQTIPSRKMIWRSLSQ